MTAIELTNTYAVVDVETTIKAYMKRKASPFIPEQLGSNWIVAAGWKFAGGTVQGAYYGEDRDGYRGLMRMLLAGRPKLLGGFNIKFDLLHLLRDDDDYAAYQEWVAGGGLVWDGQLAEYLLDGMVQESHMLSLDEVAPRYGGDTKIDEVKALWEKGVDTHLIPRQLLMDYLTGRDGVGGDISNTEVIMLGQLKAARERGMLNSIRLNMGALLASVEMERNGLWVNKALGLEQAAKLQADIERMRGEMHAYLPADLPFEFNWNSSRQKSALIFGGQVKYEARESVLDAQGGQAYAMKEEEHYVLSDGSTVPVVDGQPVPHHTLHYTGGQKKGMPKTKKVKVPDKSKPKTRIADFWYSFPGYTKPRKEWEGSEPGVYSTRADIIEELSGLYAEKESNGATPVRSGVEPAQPGQATPVQPGKATETEVRPNPIELGGDDRSGGAQVRTVPAAGGSGLQERGADDNALRGAGPRPRDGSDSRGSMSLVQPSNRDAGRHTRKLDAGGEVSRTAGRFFKLLGDLQDRTKDLTTYYLTVDDKGEEKGMLTLVGEDGVVHHGVNHTSTVTGRLSHSNPNMGNLPRGDTSEVKRMFGSRHGADGVIVSSDFKTLEIYCQAMLTGDKQLIADLRANLDMHCARLATVEGKPYDEVLKLAKGCKKCGPGGSAVEAVPEWDVKRTLIKRFSFQRAYGAGAPKIAATIKADVDDVKQWIEADERRYPGTVAWFEKESRIVENSRVPTNTFITHPDLKVRIQLHRGQYKTFDGKRYTFTESPAPEFLAKKGTLQSFSPTELKNYPVQGLGGEWMKAAMWLAVRAFYRYKNFGGLALLVNTVHDALYADVHGSVRRKAGVVIHASMLAASDLIEYLFGTPVPVPVPADTGFGSSMYEEQSFEDSDAFDASAHTFRNWLRHEFMEGYTPSYIQETA